MRSRRRRRHASNQWPTGLTVGRRSVAAMLVVDAMWMCGASREGQGYRRVQPVNFAFRRCAAGNLAAMKGRVTPAERSERPIDPGVVIGHVHMRAADLEKIHDFYVGVLGFDVVARIPDALFLSA